MNELHLKHLSPVSSSISSAQLAPLMRPHFTQYPFLLRLCGRPILRIPPQTYQSRRRPRLIQHHHEQILPSRLRSPPFPPPHAHGHGRFNRFPHVIPAGPDGRTARFDIDLAFAVGCVQNKTFSARVRPVSRITQVRKRHVGYYTYALAMSAAERPGCSDPAFARISLAPHSLSPPA